MALTYRITTLGCRVNHAEAREIESVLRARGLAPAASAAPADVEVVHTCSVTGAAAAKSRNAVRRAVRRLRPGEPRGPGPEVFVTGCYASTDPEEARSLGGPEVIGHPDADGASMLDRFTDRLDGWLTAAGAALPPERRRGASSRTLPTGPAGPGRRTRGLVPLPVIPPRTVGGRHVRAELKIQDGCDAHCTFCIIPRIRSTLRSKTVADAVTEAQRLVELGHGEVVLTGVFISAYGHETALRRRQPQRRGDPLADLIDAVAQVPGLRRLRISSLEPGDVSEALLDAMVANSRVVVPHLHLPLQSGSDAILRRMNRQYCPGEYLEMIDRVEGALATADGLPPAITTDIICGFPGETESDFEQTVTVARRVGYLHMHVFPFSPRRGTAAARWTDNVVPGRVVRGRVRRLIEMEDDPVDGLSIVYRRRLRGRVVRVILEQAARRKPGIMTGRCDHYALISVRSDLPRGTLVNVRITRVTPATTRGTIVAAPWRLPVL